LTVNCPFLVFLTAYSEPPALRTKSPCEKEEGAIFIEQIRFSRTVLRKGLRLMIERKTMLMFLKDFVENIQILIGSAFSLRFKTLFCK
jgi:hypothetical protein